MGKCHVKVNNSYYETKIDDTDIIANMCSNNKLIALVGGDYISGNLVEEVRNLNFEMENKEIEAKKYITKFAENVAELVNQIKVNDYTDSLGHKLKNNKAYIDLVNLIEEN